MNEFKNQIEELREENQFLKKCARFSTLIALYFELLPKHRTNYECFNYINNRYFELVGEHLYTDYDSFIRTVRYHRNKNKA